jgi:hypothetical protein
MYIKKCCVLASCVEQARQPNNLAVSKKKTQNATGIAKTLSRDCLQVKNSFIFHGLSNLARRLLYVLLNQQLNQKDQRNV